MKELGIITINFERPQILKLWCSQITRLRNDTQVFFPAVVVSEEEDKTTCQRHGIGHITFPNEPVTAKFNEAFRFMRTQGVDYVMILGSDDVISTVLLQNTFALMEEDIDVMGLHTLYFYGGDGVERGNLYRLDRPSQAGLLGIAKTVSRKILDQCDWILWNKKKNSGMDAIAQRTINDYATSRAVVQGMAVDVKTRKNLNSIRVWNKRLPKINPQEFYNILSEEELLILRNL